MNFPKTTTIILFLFSLAFPAICSAEDRVLIFAAASATNAVTEITKLYEREKGVKVLASFASSSTLAKQLEAGAPAHIYLSANPKWMDYLEKKSILEPKTRRKLLGNYLVVVAPKGRTFPLEIKKGFDFAGAFTGKLAMGDPLHVPAGIYGKEALLSLGWWNSVASRVVGAMDVRFALSFVERGEAAAGIVYATDAKLSDKVEVAGVFPGENHAPISYPAALIRGAGPQAREFYEFLGSEQAGAIFSKYGFKVEERRP